MRYLESPRMERMVLAKQHRLWEVRENLQLHLDYKAETEYLSA